MSDERSTHEHVQFNTKIQVYAPIMIFCGGAFTLFSLLMLGVFAATHWTTFVAITVGLVYAVLALVGIVAIAGILWLALALWHKYAIARGAHMRNRVLHTSPTYAIVEIQGQAEVIPISQEKYNYSIRQDARGIATRAGDITGDDRLLAIPESNRLSAPTSDTDTSVLSFRELLEAGTVQNALNQGRMLLGYTGGKLRYGSWLSLYSCGIGGVSGSGKTTTVRFLLFQAILAGAQLIMVDPHIHDKEESLAAQFTVFTHAHIIPPCDSNTNAVLKRVRWLSKELARRKDKGIKTPFLVFVIDEFNAVMRDTAIREEMSTLLVSIAQEGRKFGVFAMLIGQRWSSQDIGGADIRTSLASTLAHRFTDEEQAKKLVGSRNGPRCLELSTGHYLFRDTNGGLHEMETPYTDVSDGVTIQQLLQASSTGYATGYETTSETTSETTRKPLETTSESTKTSLVVTPSFQRETTRKPLETTSESTKIEAMARQVVLLQAQGKAKPDIMRQVWNVNPGGSQAYEQATQEYLQVMQFIAEKLGA